MDSITELKIFHAEKQNFIKVKYYKRGVKKKGNGCCKPWIDPDEDERKNWELFRKEVSDFTKDESFRQDFVQDLSDLSESMFSAKDIIYDLEDKCDSLREKFKNVAENEKNSIIYEITEKMDFLSAKMEDVEFLIKKILDRKNEECIKKEEDENLAKVLVALIDNIKTQVKILYEILQIRYNYLVEKMELMQLGIP